VEPVLAYQLLNILQIIMAEMSHLWSVENAGSTFTIRFPIATDEIASSLKSEGLM
jgi:hypothetical protein